MRIDALLMTLDGGTAAEYDEPSSAISPSITLGIPTGSEWPTDDPRCVPASSFRSSLVMSSTFVAESGTASSMELCGVARSKPESDALATAATALCGTAAAGTSTVNSSACSTNPDGSAGLLPNGAALSR